MKIGVPRRRRLVGGPRGKVGGEYISREVCDDELREVGKEGGTEGCDWEVGVRVKGEG